MMIFCPIQPSTCGGRKFSLYTSIIFDKYLIMTSIFKTIISIEVQIQVKVTAYNTTHNLRQWIRVNFVCCEKIKY